MIQQFTITNTAWTAITLPGASAMAWKDEQDDGIVGRADVVVVNSPVEPNTQALGYGRRVYKPNGMLEGHELVADSYEDRYWARCRNAGDQAIITVASPYGKTVGIHEKHTEPGGALMVQTQDNQSESVGLRVCQFLNAITLTAPVYIDAYVINVAVGHGLVSGNTVCLRESGRFYQAIVLSVATNAITLDTPLDYSFTVSAVGFRSIDNMAVDGSVTPIIFKVSPPAGTKWDIYGYLATILDDGAMDDGKFGSLNALTKGLVIRKKDGTYKNLLNIKKNSDFSTPLYPVEYSAKAPAGVNGVTARNVFPGNYGVVIRLDSNLGDEFQVIVSENLTTLTSVKFSVWGHKVS